MVGVNRYHPDTFPGVVLGELDHPVFIGLRGRAVVTDKHNHEYLVIFKGIKGIGFPVYTRQAEPGGGRADGQSRMIVGVRLVSRCSGLACGYCQQIPGSMRQPLFGPAPVIVFSDGGIRKVEVDVVFVIEAGGDAVDDAARCVGVFKGAKETIGGDVVYCSLKDTCVQGDGAEYPVPLVEGTTLQGGWKSAL